jgi:SAM-dependent methyltransferase
MRPLSRDYDADPGRFLSTDRHPHDDVHPYVAARFAAAGARTVLDVGGGHGRLTRLLPALGLRGLLVDLSAAMLDLAPRPAVRADGARLPAADASVDAVAALYTLYHYDDPLRPIREARRVLRPGGLFAACAPNRDSTPELAHVIPGWGSGTTFDGEDAEAIVASAFGDHGDGDHGDGDHGDGDHGDTVETDRWDGPLVTLGSAVDAAAFLRVHRLDEKAAADVAAGLDLPMTLTMRGCVVYATKAGIRR